jgi:hypothetical protein
VATTSVPAAVATGRRSRVLLVAASVTVGSLLGAGATAFLSDDGSASRPLTAENPSTMAPQHHVCSSRVPTDCSGP